MPKEDVWKERENYDLLAHVLILLLLLYGFVCVLCVYLGVHGKWGADPLRFPRLELKRNCHRQESVSYEFGHEGF